jgi:aerobic carbon-monoxide dehydrogenase small subunit
MMALSPIRSVRKLTRLPAKIVQVSVTVELKINGKATSLTTDPRRVLLDVLREDLHLTGTKYGCGEGQCRACTVLLNGTPVASCLVPVTKAENKEIVTIEGLARGEALHPVQEAFLQEGAMQCGYCVPGMVLTAVSLLERKPNPSPEEIVEAMNSNLCRCCGYPRILSAVRRAAEEKALSKRG